MGLIKMAQNAANNVAQGAKNLFQGAANTMPGQMIGGGIRSSYYDTVLEYFRCENLSDDFVMVPATKVLRNGAVNKGSDGVITNGSVFDVAINQAAILIENGRVHDFVIGIADGTNDTTGRYRYDSSLEPSLISGGLKDVLDNGKAQLLEAANRMRFGGQSSNTMRLIYINLKEIKGNKIGIGGATFYDNRYNASLELKGHGTFSYRIANPVAFYQNMTYDPTKPLKADDLLEEFRSNITTVLDPTIGAIESVCERGYVDIKKHSHELAGYANQFLKERGTWNNRGVELVEISLTLQPTEESKQKIAQYEASDFYSDPSKAAGLQAQGMFKAMSGIGEGAAKGGSGGGTDSMGAMMGMMGMSMMNNMNQQQYAQQYTQPVYGQLANQMPAPQPYQNPYAYPQQGNVQAPGYPSQVNQNQPYQNPYGGQQGYGQPQMQQPYGQQAPNNMQQPIAPTQEVANEPNVQQAPVEQTPITPVIGWTCTCGAINQGKFCMECGSKKPADAPLYRCDKCGWVPTDPKNPPKFCPECGDRFDDDDAQS